MYPLDPLYPLPLTVPVSPHEVTSDIRLSAPLTPLPNPPCLSPFFCFFPDILPQNPTFTTPGPDEYPAIAPAIGRVPLAKPQLGTQSSVQLSISPQDRIV